MRIKRLERVLVESHEDGTQLSKLPSQQEMMEKINQIIEVVNELDDFKNNPIVDKYFKDMTKGF